MILEKLVKSEVLIMDSQTKELLKNIVYKFAKLSSIADEKECDDFIVKLSSLDIDEVIDTILIYLDNLVAMKMLPINDVLSNVNLILSLNPDKYHTTSDLIERLNWIKSMNLVFPEMSLSENHKLVIETFDKFNELIQANFDCFYTGGLIGYLATNQPLERYHHDLDLLINEEQLPEFYELIKNSNDFKFVSNVNNKEEHGHEYKVTYKDTPMSIGLFLFSRLPNQEIVLKKYYYSDLKSNQELYVDEHHLLSKYASMMFSDKIRKHNGFIYKMQTLESIYHAKNNSRPKDRYDATKIKDYCNQEIVYRLETERQDNYDIKYKIATDSVVQKMEDLIKNSKAKTK